MSTSVRMVSSEPNFSRRARSMSLVEAIRISLGAFTRVTARKRRGMNIRVRA